MKKLFSLLFVLFVALSFNAQQYKSIPIDPQVRKGVLDNGLTYYIRHNEQPKNRCDFHIAQNVGSILENDNQLGLAHFLEHMAFNGSEHFPDKGIINYFEKIGVSFGRNINAYTSIDETVYRLSDVPTTREGMLDSALLTLYDWSCALTLADEEIDKERGVIVAEWRTTNSPNRRLMTELYRKVYAGSQYANRMPIGDTTIVKNFTYEALRDYYHKWYGADLQAIVVVGDIDVDKMEQKIKNLFNKAPERKNRGERPMYGLKDNEKPIVAFAKDKEAQNSLIQVQFKHKSASKDFKLSSAGYAQSLLDNIVSTIFGYRFKEITLNPNANIIQSFVGREGVAKTTDALYSYTVAKEGKEKEALGDVLSELYKVVQHGFTNSEIKRAKTDILNAYEKSYNERNTVNNQRLAREYIRNYIDDEPIPGIEWEYDFVKKIMPSITKEQLHKFIQAYVTEHNIIISFAGADKPEVNFPTENEVLSMLNNARTAKYTAPKEEEAVKSLVENIPMAGKVVKRNNLSSLGVEEWTLSNGVKVVFKTTDFKEDEINLNAFSWGGTNTLSIEDLPSAYVAADIVARSGLGDFSYLELEKILTGKTANAIFSINDDTEEIFGKSSVKDFETMLQLVNLNFRKPRKDDNAYVTLIELYSNYIKNRINDPKAIFSDTLVAQWSCFDKRNVFFNENFLEKVSHDKALKIFHDRFSNANDFTFVFTGNINPEDKNVEKLICTWLGSLPKGKIENYVPQANCHPKGKYKHTFQVDMEIDNPKNFLRMYAPMEYNWSNTLNMKIIGYILDYRYLESIRENEGGSYGVGVYGRVSKLPNEEGILTITFDCHPEKQQRLMEIVYKEIDNLLKNGPSDVDFNKAKEGLIKEYAENLEQNGYWSSIIETYYQYGRNYAKDYRNAIDAVTKETLKDTLKELMKAGNTFELFMFRKK